MKNILLFIIALCFTGAYSQGFPDPYCDIDDPMIDVEEITQIELGDTIIENTNNSDVLVNETATIVEVEQGQTYSISVQGFTDGNYDNNVYAFIDWNQNATLDDDGEVFEVGTLTNSTGTDGQSVSIEITIPEDAVLGETRIRVLKAYGDEDAPSVANPCDIVMTIPGFGDFPGYGQAIDFTLDIQEGDTNNGEDEFPSPYCDIDDPMIEVEEITVIEFGDTTIVNENNEDVLVNETATVVEVEQGQTYTLSVEGFTAGDFDNDVYAYIDWNQNTTLDDEGETYVVGILTNSTGEDGQAVSIEITVPEDAMLGETRIRISKIYGDEDSPSIMDPCDISMDVFGMGGFAGYGQAIDFTLNISEGDDNNGEDEFPSPYCDIDDPMIEVEEITVIEFGDTTIVNENNEDVLVNETATVVEVEQGQTYTLSVEGFTAGDFDNDVYAYIDWNQNTTLDDEGEAYVVGTLTNSTGEDGQAVSIEITVPEDAVLGETRIRISKIYGDEDSPSIMDPCDISMDVFGMGGFAGYGQAIDFTLNILEGDDNNGEDEFPSPYCDIDDPMIEVEEITVIEFGDTTIVNENNEDVLVNETATVVEVEQGQTYTLSVEGFTAGDFDNDVYAYIDWNQNTVLDDEGEAYVVGTLTNSTGEDGQAVSIEITVPEDAVLGETRIRISKIYGDEDSPSIMDPCDIAMDAFGMGAFAGYGQAIDFTLNISVMGVEEFDQSTLSVYPVPTDNFLNISYKSELTQINIYNLLGQEVISEKPESTEAKIDVSGLSEGVYLVKLFTEKGSHQVKFIKR